MRVIEYDIANREDLGPTPIRLITTILTLTGLRSNSPPSITNAGNLNPVSLRSKPASAAVTGSWFPQSRDGTPRDLGVAVDSLRNPHADV